jgi:hypothetical protein
MNVILLLVSGIALIAAGAGATFALASTLSQQTLQHARSNGRYAGLAADDRSAVTGGRKTQSQPRSAHRPVTTA